MPKGRRSPRRRTTGCPAGGRLISVALLVALTCALVALPRAEPAGAVILPATTIDGPSRKSWASAGWLWPKTELAGLVYLKKVDGVAHVFVSRFVGGHWLAPIQVDRGQPFAASWPRIGAANDGELVVVWATPFATEKEEGSERPVDELLGSTLGAGIRGIRPRSDRRPRHRRRAPAPAPIWR